MATENPFSVLSYIVAPALLTNTTALLLMGTTNRFARAVDRARAVAERVTKGVAGADPELDRLTETELGICRRRVNIIQERAHGVLHGAAPALTSHRRASARRWAPSLPGEREGRKPAHSLSLPLGEKGPISLPFAAKWEVRAGAYAPITPPPSASALPRGRRLCCAW